MGLSASYKLPLGVCSRVPNAVYQTAVPAPSPNILVPFKMFRRLAVPRKEASKFFASNLDNCVALPLSAPGAAAREATNLGLGDLRLQRES